MALHTLYSTFLKIFPHPPPLANIQPSAAVSVYLVVELAGTAVFRGSEWLVASG